MGMKKKSNEQVLLENKTKSIVHQCSACGKCYKVCPMMDSFGENPKKVLNRHLLEAKDINVQLPFSCMLCGSCQRVCPFKLPLPELFLEYRQWLYEKKGRTLKLKGVDGIYRFQKLVTSSWLRDKGE